MTRSGKTPPRPPSPGPAPNTATPRSRVAKKRVEAIHPQELGVAAQVTKIPSPAALHARAVALEVMETLGGSKVRTFSFRRETGCDRFRLERPSGDWLEIVFSTHGHTLYGFDHESPMSPYRGGYLWPGLLSGLSSALAARIEAASPGDERFADTAGSPESYPAITFATWWARGQWRHGDIAFPAFDAYESDGAAYLLECIDPQVEFVEQKGWDKGLVATILRHEPLSGIAMNRLVPGANEAEARRVMKALGYGLPFPFDP